MSSLVIGLTMLGLVSLTSFVIAFKNTKWTLVILVPAITAVSCFTVYSYKDLMGLPVNAKWEDLPKEIRIVFFKVENKDKILIWVEENRSSKLYRVENTKEAKDMLVQNKKSMKSGGVMTLVKIKKSEEESAVKGFPYKFKSIGEVVPGSLPPK